ncbi:hypothetical protein ACVXHA_30365 [Escherichia coli]
MMRLSLPRLKMPRLQDSVVASDLHGAKRLGDGLAGKRYRQPDHATIAPYCGLTFGLAAIGFIMVTSASMPIGQRLTNDPFLREA